MKVASQLVRNSNKKAHIKQKQQYDKRVRFQPFQVDQLVYLTNPKSVRNKLATKWIGPFRLVQVFNDGLNYQIIDPLSPSAVPKVVHYNRLKPRYQSDGRYDIVQCYPFQDQFPNQGIRLDHRPIPSQVSRAQFRRLRNNRFGRNGGVPQVVSPRIGERCFSTPSSPGSPKTPSPSFSRQLPQAVRGMPRDGAVSRFGRTIKPTKRLTYQLSL